MTNVHYHQDPTVLPSDFQRAAAAAKARVGARTWEAMTPYERPCAIYAELRAIDAIRAQEMPPVQRRRRFRVAGEPTKRTSLA